MKKKGEAYKTSNKVASKKFRALSNDNMDLSRVEWKTGTHKTDR